MADAIEKFFGAWSETAAEARSAAIASSMADSFVYSDPRTPGRLSDLDSLIGYITAFGENAPGWVAESVKTDTHNGFFRTVVAFGEAGQRSQWGTYFGALDDAGRITLLSGFVGLGDAVSE